MTVSVFQSRFASAARRISGSISYSEGLFKQYDIARMKRELLLKALRFHTFFPEVEL